MASRHATRAAFGAAVRALRGRTIGFAVAFGLYAYAQPVAYRHAYPDVASRLAFAHSFGGNRALVIFYGKAYDLLSVGGYTAWRVGGVLAILAAVFGLLTAVRGLRGEEETGRLELVLSGVVGRGHAFAAVLVALAGATAVLWLAELAGLTAAGLPLGSSAYLALATVSVVPVFTGLGALTSQLAPTRRLALELGGGVLAAALLLRMVADTSSGAGALRWLTPLGWAEDMRPFTGAHPFALALLLAATALLLGAAGALALGRDVGTGLLGARDARPPRLRLLSSVLGQSLRAERTSIGVWTGSASVWAFVLGVVAAGISSGSLSPSLRRAVDRLGAGELLTPRGYLSLSFLFFVLLSSLFGVAQVAAAHREELEGRLESLMALPVGRTRWLASRLLLGAAGAFVIALAAGFFAWAGAASQRVAPPLGELLVAGLNCLPVALLFLSLAALAHALAPRAGTAVAYGLVMVAFLWQLLGSLLGVPRWVVKLTPFAHVGMYPARPLQEVAAAVMVGIAAAAAACALACFQRRDLAMG